VEHKKGIGGGIAALLISTLLFYNRNRIVHGFKHKE